jgi:cell division protein FtsI (penicillin-binding protein 3)
MKRRRSPKHRKYRRKRTLIASLAIFLVPVVLTSLVFALQHDFSNLDPQTADVPNLQFLSPDGNDQNRRGTVYDKNLNQIATSYHITSAFVHPSALQDPCTAAEKLAAILPLDINELKSKLNTETGFLPLAKDIDSATAAQITALKIEGVSLRRESKRQYPYEEHGAHIVGFADNGQGLDGIEFYYDSLLRDGSPEQLPASLMDQNLPEGFGNDGVHLILTLDMQVQELLQSRLDSMIKKTNAAAGVAAIMNPENGAVVAIANLPSFDPNHFWDADDQTLRNRFNAVPLASSGIDSFLKQAMSFHDVRRVVQEKMREARQTTLKSDTLLLVPDSTKKRVYDFDNIVNVALLNSLIKKASLQIPPPFDLPTLHTGLVDTNQPGSGVTALQLLTEFSSITVGGSEISPHLLHSVFDEATGRAFPAKYKSSDAAFNNEIVQILEYIGQRGAENTLTLESIISAVDHDFLHQELPSNEDSESSRHPVSYAMLSFIPSEEESLALIIVLDNADLFKLVGGTGDSSIPKTIIDKSFFQKTKKWALAPAKEPSLAMLESLQQVRPSKKKNKIGKTSAVKSLAEHTVATMPEITGQSLRQGLQILQSYNLKISVSGSGMITAQKPKAGKKIQAGDTCLLQLSANR